MIKHSILVLDEYLLLFNVAFYIGAKIDIKGDHRYILLDSYMSFDVGEKQLWQQ